MAADWHNRIVGHDEVPPDQLLAHPLNFRPHPKHQQDALRGVIADIGYIRSVLVNRTTGRVIDGHLRVTLAMRDDVPLIPVEYVELTEAEEAEALATFDALTGLATLDAGNLDALLREVTTGNADVQQLLDDLATAAGVVPGLDVQAPGLGGGEFDTTPQDGPTRTQVGDLWQLGRHRLLVGDCTIKEQVDRLMDGRRADMAWFDPPFGIDLQPQRGNTAAIAGDENADARHIWAAFLPLLVEALNNDVVAFLCQGWSEFDWTLPLVREHLAIKSKIVWNKNNFGIGYYLRPQHEDILYCWKGTPPRPDVAQSDVWDVARLNAPQHAAEKPVALTQRAIEFAAPAGGLVIDWFAGVGGTLIAAERTGRTCYGVEIEPRYADVCIRRFEAETGQTAVKIDAITRRASGEPAEVMA